MDTDLDVYVVMCRYLGGEWDLYKRGRHNGLCANEADALRMANDARKEFNDNEVVIKQYKASFVDEIDMF